MSRHVALKVEDRQWRQGQVQGIWPAMKWNWRGFNSAEITVTVPTVIAGVAVENLSPRTPIRNSDSVVGAKNGSKITDHEHDLILGFSLPQKANDARGGVGAIDPLET